MKHLSLCLLLATATAAPLAAQTPSPKGGDKIIPEPIILHACVTAGTEKNTYMLSNVIRADQPVGTSGSNRAGANAFYWLSSGSALKDHVGQLVRVSGMLEEDVDKTETRLTKDGTVEVVTERTKSVEVPAGTVAAAAAGPEGLKRLSYKVKVRSIERLPGGCAPQ